MKKIVNILLLLTCSISFCMAQNIKEAAKAQQQREAQQQQAAEVQKRQQQQAAEEQKQREAQQQQLEAEEQRQREAQQPKVSVTTDGTLIRGSSLSTILDWLNRNVESHNTYIVEMIANDNISPQTLQYRGAINITIILRGDGENRIIRLNSHGRMFTVPANVTFILDNNITLMGHNQNTGTMIYVDGGTFIMNNRAVITGNIREQSNSGGGGVYVNSGTFTMNGGSINNNTANSGGGVYVYNRTTFIMNGGTISNNSAKEGGGVYVCGNYTQANFTMRGGNISSNIAYSHGGGVYTGKSNFTKTGGTITGYGSDTNIGNKVADFEGTIARRGHAVYVNENLRKETTAGPGMNLSGSNADNWVDSPLQYTENQTVEEYEQHNDAGTVENEQTNNSDAITNNEPAVLYIYRKRRPLDLIPKRYDILLDNVVVATSTNNWKTSVTINTFGTKTLTAVIDGKRAEIRNNYRPGGIYYVRSDVDTKTIDTGKTKTYTDKNGKTTTSKVTEIQYTPILQLVDKGIGESELNAIK